MPLLPRRLACACLLLVAGTAACRRGTTKEAESEPPIPVVTEAVQLGNIRAVVSATGVVVALPGGGHTAYAHAELWSLPAGGGAAGTADVAEVDAGTRVRLRADHLPVRQGTSYELWCVRTDGRWVNGGSFHARADGTAAADLTAAVRPGEYHVVVITRRSAGGERGDEVMRGKLNY